METENKRIELEITDRTAFVLKYDTDNNAQSAMLLKNLNNAGFNLILGGPSTNNMEFGNEDFIITSNISYNKKASYFGGFAREKTIIGVYVKFLQEFYTNSEKGNVFVNSINHHQQFICNLQTLEIIKTNK